MSGNHTPSQVSGSETVVPLGRGHFISDQSLLSQPHGQYPELPSSGNPYYVPQQVHYHYVPPVCSELLYRSNSDLHNQMVHQPTVVTLRNPTEVSCFCQNLEIFSYN